MEALEIADRLHEEATRLVYDGGLDATLRDYGGVSYTGSFALNLMACPDIDVSMVLEPEPFSLDAFFAMGRRMAELRGVWRLGFRNQLRREVGSLPRGLYWGVRLDVGRPSTTWKVDIWALDQPQFARAEATTERFRKALTDEARRLIVEIKHSLLTPEGRTPVLSGYHICEAVLSKGLTTEAQVREYLKQQGIEGV